MALPINTTPVYTLKIPSTKKEFKYRSFLVKEEKALLTAQQSEDNLIMLDTIKDVIKSCAKSPIDVDNLATFDVEYIFLQLRSVSIGEFVDLMFQCDVCTDEKARSNVRLNLQAINVNFPEEHTTKIPLFGNVGMVMKYPTLDAVKKIEEMDTSSIEDVINIAIECVDYIYSEDEVFPAAEQKPEEITEFINNLTTDQFGAIQKFFTTMPSLKHYVNYTCPVCSKEHSKYLEGLASFF